MDNMYITIRVDISDSEYYSNRATSAEQTIGVTVPSEVSDELISGVMRSLFDAVSLATLLEYRAEIANAKKEAEEPEE